MRAKAAHLDEFRKSLAAESDDDATRSSSGGGSSAANQQQQSQPSQQKQHHIDLSMLRKPIMTAVTGFLEAHRAYESGTDEIRKLLTSECDLMYECRVCRNIFRSLTNFISHKRVYCRKLFNAAQHFHFQNDGFLDQDISTILQAEQDSQRKAKKVHADILNKDLSSIIERLRRKQHKLTGELSMSEYYDRINHKLTLDDLNRQHHLLQLDRVPNSNAAVYQTVREQDNSDATDNMSAQIGELEALAAKRLTVLGPDGKVIEPRSRPQSALPVISDPSNQYFQPIELDKDNSTTEARDSIIFDCQECNLQFDTERTLKLHMEIKHTPSTFVYPCPSCQKTFTQPGAVIRHLTNDHKKTMRRIKVMRDSIFKRRTRVDEIVVKGASREVARLAQYGGAGSGSTSSSRDRNGHGVEEERDEAAATRAWMENLEHFDQGPMCSYCGKTFDRKAVLTTHMQTCPQKIRQTENGAGSVPPAGGGSSWGSSSSSGRRSKVKEELATPAAPATVTRIKQEVVDVIASDDSNSYDVPLSKLQARISLEGAAAKKNESSASTAAVNGVVTVKPEEFGMQSEESRNRRKRQKPTIMLRNANDDISWEVDEQGAASEGDSVIIKQEPVEVISVIEEELPKPKKVAPRNRKKKLDESLEVNDDALERQIETDGQIVCKCSKKYKDTEKYKHHLRVFHSRQRRFWCAICVFKGYRKVDTVNHLMQEHGYKGSAEEIESLINFQPVEKPKKTLHKPSSEAPEKSNQEAVNRSYDTSAMESSFLESTMESLSLDQSINTSAIIPSSTPEAASPKKRGRPRGSIRDSICSTPLDDSTKRLKLNDHTPAAEEDCLSPTSRRPIRNRVKPVDKDFVYDLTHLLHKEEDLDDFPLPELIQDKPPPTVRQLQPSPVKPLPPPPPPPPPPAIVPLSCTRSSSISSRNSTSAASTPEKRDSSTASNTTNSKKESLRSHAPKPKPAISPELFRGAAYAMAKRQVDAGRAAFRSPPPIPQERAFIPSQMSPPKQQQSDNSPQQQRRIQTIHDWPVLKKERRIGSIGKHSDIQIKHKYVKNAPQIAADLLREQRKVIPRRNSVAPQSRRISAAVKILDKLNETRTAAGLDVLRVADVPMYVPYTTSAEFRRFIDSNLKDHRATMAQANVNGTTATGGEVSAAAAASVAARNTRMVADLPAGDTSPTVSPRKRITLMQRIEENRCKRLQEQNGTPSPTKSQATSQPSSAQGSSPATPSNNSNGNGSSSGSSVISPPTNNVADMIQAKLKRFSPL